MSSIKSRPSDKQAAGREPEVITGSRKPLENRNKPGKDNSKMGRQKQADSVQGGGGGKEGGGGDQKVN